MFNFLSSLNSVGKADISIVQGFHGPTYVDWSLKHASATCFIIELHISFDIGLLHNNFFTFGKNTTANFSCHALLLLHNCGCGGLWHIILVNLRTMPMPCVTVFLSTVTLSETTEGYKRTSCDPDGPDSSYRCCCYYGSQSTARSRCTWGEYIPRLTHHGQTRYRLMCTYLFVSENTFNHMQTSCVHVCHFVGRGCYIFIVSSQGLRSRVITL